VTIYWGMGNKNKNVIRRSLKMSSDACDFALRSLQDYGDFLTRLGVPSYRHLKGLEDESASNWSLKKELKK
jgi:hypothetical protein